MIEDLDGPEQAPRRRGHMLVVSALLLVGVAAGYAAVSSKELRGPYATPYPSASVAPVARVTPVPFASVEPASAAVPLGGCITPGSVFNATVFVGGQMVTISRPITPSVSSSCVAFWTHPADLLPFDRFAR